MIIHIEEVGSTNDWLLERAAGLEDGQWLRVDRQSAGRGRQQRPWQGSPGNLAASCLVRLQPGEDRAAELGFVAALALHESVASVVDGSRLRLKWPNDLLLDGAKLSGILLERTGAEVVIGFGVNLATAPEVTGRRTSSLGGIVAPDTFCEMLAASFAKWRCLWRENGFALIRSRWLALAHPPGTALQVTTGAIVTNGRFAGLAEDGALMLQLPDNSMQVVHAGDVWEG